MKKTILVLIFLFGALAQKGIAQQKTELTLSEAVIGAYGEFRPQSIQQFAWQPNGHGYSYKTGAGDAERLVIKNASNRSQREVTLTMLSNAVKAAGGNDLSRFPSVSWLSENVFLIDVQYTVFRYNVDQSTASTVMSYSEQAQNVDFNKANKALAYTQENNLFVLDSLGGVHQVTQHENKAVVAGQAIHRYEFGIRKGTFWSPTGDHLAFYEKDDSNIPEFPLVDYAADPAETNMIRYPKSGREFQIPKVGVYNLATSKLTYLKLGKTEEWFQTNLTWGPEGKYIYLVELDRDQRNLALVKYDAKTGDRLETLFTESHEKYIEPEHGPIFFPDNSGDFLWFSKRDGYNHLYRYKASGKLVKQMTKGNFDVAEFVGFGAKAKFALVDAYAPVLEKNTYKVDLRKGGQTRLTNEEGYHTANLSEDGKYFAVRWTAPAVPRQNDLYSIDGKRIKTIDVADDPLTDKKLGTTTIEALEAEDGTTLYGRLIKPVDFDENKKYPVLVYVYGGPHVQLVNKGWLNGAGLWMHYMANQGYLVFTLDNRGTSNRGLAFEQATFRNLGTLEIEDQLKGVEFLKSLPYVDTERMAVYGWSFGGFMTASLMLRTPGVFQAGVAGGAVTDWNSYEVMYTERYMDTPEQNPEGYQRSDLRQYTQNLTGDLLLIHGTVDDVVILDHSMDLLKSFIDNGIQVDYFQYPGHAHNVRGKDRLHLKRKVLDYVMEHLETE